MFKSSKTLMSAALISLLIGNSAWALDVLVPGCMSTSTGDAVEQGVQVVARLEQGVTNTVGAAFTGNGSFPVAIQIPLFEGTPGLYNVVSVNTPSCTEQQPDGGDDPNGGGDIIPGGNNDSSIKNSNRDNTRITGGDDNNTL